MGLTEYRRKRDFKVTKEPRGGRVAKRARRGLAFVIQKHAASHLHYDFRLELDGVLLSWAVPKGPSLDPATKRLAMHVEDHPIEYGDFEGIIPEGEYGGGTVLLWDKGTWEPVDDAQEGYRDGALKFELHGEKLSGKWMLVRKGGKRAPEEKNWFLFKEKDEYAKPGSDIAKSGPLSVVSGRDLDEIASDADRVWGPKGEVKGKRRALKSKVKNEPEARNGTPRKPKPQTLSAADKAAITKKLKEVGEKQSRVPLKQAVELATLIDKPPTGDSWMHEIKFDGYRMLCRIVDGKAQFISRNGKEWTAKFADLPTEVLSLPVNNALLDGEVVVLEEDGKSSFQALQNAFESTEAVTFYYYVFDLLHLNGFDLTDAPLEDRKEILKRLLRKSKGAIRFSDHVIGNGEAFFDEASKLGLEGIISKRLGRPYTPGRGNDWLKVKCSLREEFVIGGYTKPEGARSHFGALLLGYYNRSGELVYAGRVGTGFSDVTLKELHQKFQKLIQKSSSFSNLRGTTGQARGVTWLMPELVGQVQFSNWTGDQQLRHPSFQGLREDKVAKKVVRDEPVSSESITSTKRVTGASARASNGRSRSTKTASDSSENEVAGVTLSHPDKVLYPEDGFTKLDLARYYESAAEWMLPHVSGRLLSLVRCPAGSGQKCFFQKHPGEGTSELLARTEVAEKDGPEDYLSVKDLPGLISLVQMGVLEIHLWGSRADKFEKPDRLIFDLDPDPAVKWPEVVSSAKEVRVLLQELGLQSFVKTTGGKGLHVAVPIERRISWDDAKAFCKSVADLMVRAAPNRYIAKMSKAARKGKIFVDYLRNDRGATAVAPYSTRAKPGATVSVPLTWDELTAKLHSDHFTIKNLPTRLAKLKADPWGEISEVKQSITAGMLKQLAAI